MSGQRFGGMELILHGSTISIASVTFRLVRYTLGSGKVRCCYGWKCLLGYWLVIVWILGICCEEDTGMLRMSFTVFYARRTQLKIGCTCSFTVTSVCVFGTIYRLSGRMETPLNRFSGERGSSSKNLSLRRWWFWPCGISGSNVMKLYFKIYCPLLGGGEEDLSMISPCICIGWRRSMFKFCHHGLTLSYSFSFLYILFPLSCKYVKCWTDTWLAGCFSFQ